jgi:hypothetical protein
MDMEELLNKAFEALKSLPPRDQSFMAWQIIDQVEDKAEWDRLTARPEAQDWLAHEAAKALKRFEKVAKSLSNSFISLGDENLLREDSYWRHFDDLPKSVKELAEDNYHIWKKNPHHPCLRFKQIHETLPIFSFRVGMKHRAVGVETDDGKVVWFWMGGFEHFKSLIAPEEGGEGKTPAVERAQAGE